MCVCLCVGVWSASQEKNNTDISEFVKFRTFIPYLANVENMVKY